MGNELERVLAIELAVDEAAVALELEGFLTGWQPAPGAVAVPRWTVDNLGKADWAIRKLAEIRATEQQYHDEVALWQGAADKLSKAGGWFEDRLKEWALESRTKDRKSFALAHGTVSTTASKARPVVADEAAAIAWAEVHCETAVQVSKKFLISLSGAQVAEWVVGYSVIDKATGVQSFHEGEAVAPLDQAALDVWRASAPGLMIEPVMEQVVVDADGARIPGLAVRAETVTASVKPLGL